MEREKALIYVKADMRGGFSGGRAELDRGSIEAAA